MQKLSYKWLVTVVVIFGMFMVLLDTTIVNTAIPHLQTTFGAPLADVNWVATGYTLAEGIGIPLMPFFSVLMGNKRFYIVILILFTIGSALCGLAWSLPALIFFRILQGLAGASMLPLSITLLFSEFPPEERGVAMGALGLPLMAAPALGPTVGGYIVTYVDWRMLFYINVPIGVVGTIMAIILLRDIRLPRLRPLFFDLPGFLACSLGLGSLLYALDKAGSDGWGSLTVAGGMTLGIISLVSFVFIEQATIKSGKDPLLDIRIFGSRTFTGGNLAMALLVFALFGGQFLIPLYLQNLRGLSAYDAGLILLPQALGSMVSSVFGGRLVDKLGVKQVVIPGLALLGFALWGLSRLSLDTPFADFQFLLILRGLALGLAIQPMSAAALAEIKPALLSQASSLNSVVRSMVSALAVALVSTVVTSRTTFHYQRLAEQVTPNSAVGQGLQQTAAALISQGVDQQVAMFAAMGQMVKQLKLQAYLLAMNDTFYKHYADKYALLEQGMRQMYDTLVTEGHAPPDTFSLDDPPPYFMRLFEHVAQHQQFYKLMLCGEGIGRFQKLVKEYVAEVAAARIHAWTPANQHLAFPPAMQVQFFAGAVLSLLAWWLENDMPLSPHQMAQYLLSFHNALPSHS